MEGGLKRTHDMNRILVFVLPALFFSLFQPAESFAQNRRTTSYASQEPDQRFVVGIAPFSLLLPSGKANLHGEWAYADNKSLSVLIGIPRRSKAPDWLSNDITVGDQGRATTNNFHSFGVVAENRFYFAHKAPRGFYLAPYLRYNRIWLDHISTNPENQGETTITGAFGGFGLGGSLGWQFRLGEHMTLDATLIGLDVKWMRGALTYATTDPDNDISAFRDQVQETVKDIPLIGSSLAASIDGDQIKVRTPGVALPAYRFNLTVNYAF